MYAMYRPASDRKQMFFNKYFFRQRREQMNQDDADEVEHHDGEIVGLHSSTFGRSCERHLVCGREVVVGSIVRFKREVLLVNREAGIEGGEASSSKGKHMHPYGF
jgi:hypothetical protein